jgi:glycosyltransferase involved in cell wall biosynthesis
MLSEARASNEKKVLIVTRDFLPYYPSLGGVIRVLKMAEFLTNVGIKVYILTARGEEISYFGYKDLVNKLNITYIDDPLQRYNDKKMKSVSNIEINKNNNIINLCKRIINDLIIPDKGLFFVSRYVKAGLRIIKEHGIKNVIVTSPPHSTQIIGFKLKKTLKSNINYIVDYRDSWNTTNIFSKKLLLTQCFSKKLEHNILKCADKFIYVSRPILNKICAMYYDLSDKAVLIMNGFDINMSLDIVPNNNECYVDRKKLKIGYFGSLSSNKNSFRNPERLFNALIKLPEYNSKIKFIIYGAVDISKKWKDKLSEIIEIHDNVSHQEAIQLMRNMDLLMILHSQENGADEVITGKLFDYLLAEKPIIVVGPKNMEAVRLTKERHLGYCADDEGDVLLMLNRVYEDWKNDMLISYSLNDVQDFSRQHQYKKILDLLR